MVIQEAFANRRPVICAGIGGMSEKVRDGVDGLHFEVRNPLDLAETLIRATVEPDLLQNLKANVPEPITLEQCAFTLLSSFGFFWLGILRLTSVGAGSTVNLSRSW